VLAVTAEQLCPEAPAGGAATPVASQLSALASLGLVACAVVDEAHVVVADAGWRTAFGNLRRESLFGRAPLVLMTASITEADLGELCGQLDVDGHTAVRSCRAVNRPELALLAIDVDSSAPGDVRAEVVRQVLRRGRQAVLVYCGTATDVGKVVKLLLLAGVDAIPYHSQVPPMITSLLPLLTGRGGGAGGGRGTRPAAA
jgi:superfamily II DNA helicase RecQ